MHTPRSVAPATTAAAYAPVNRTYVYGIAGSAAISGLLFGYDTAVVNGALVFLRAQFNLTAFQTELAATSLLWGCVLGAAMAGYLCDRYGRRRVLLLSGVLFVASAIGAALPTAAWQF